MNNLSPRIGIMGGMFDPVHNGHLQLALNARAQCGLDVVKLIPCGTPVHREGATADAARRIAMLELASAPYDWLHVDARECSIDTASYTYTTAAALRAENPDAVLFLLIGLDAYLTFDTWYRWRDLLGLVHLCVATRQGYKYESCRLERGFRQELTSRLVATADAAAQHTAGRILLASLDLPDISSTQVRRMLRKNEDISALVPAVVAAYIADNTLYT